MIMRPSVKLGKDLKKLTLGPNLGPLKYFFFVVFFDINIKNKAYSIKFYKHIVSNYKNIASYLFSVWKKNNHRPNISQLHPTASEKKPSILLSIVAKNIQGTLNIVNVHVNNN